MESELVIGLIVALLVIGATFYFMRKRGALGLRKPRTLTIFIGLCNAGKTAMFTALVGGKAEDTVTSMKPNTGKFGQASLVDFPGHRRLREPLFSLLEEAKNVVLVVDSVSIQDDRGEGAQAVADMLCDVVEAKQFEGVARVLVACTKRDELTSYTARSVRKLLQAEVARQLHSREAALGSLGNKSDADKTGYFALDEQKGFNFDTCPVPFTFVDVSSIENDSGFNLDPVKEFLGE